MLTKEEQEIYNRHLQLDEVGLEGQLKLKSSKVLVIGAGGLGCPVLQYLSAAGVGEIGVVDFDTVDKSNLHRQILYSYNSQGKKKVEESKRRLEENNPFNSIQTYSERITTENAMDLIGAYDIVVDCSDNYDTRYLVNDCCVTLDKPMVYAAIYKFEGQVSVFNYKGGPTYRCLHPESPNSDSQENCSDTGVLGILPGIIGSFQANEVLKLILEIGEPLSGVLFQYSALTNRLDKFKFTRKEHEIYDQIRRGELNPDNYGVSCGLDEIQEITDDEFREACAGGVQLIDVRNLDELPRLDHLNALRIPLLELESRVEEIDKTKSTVVFCQSGKRSKIAIQTLMKTDRFERLINLKNGVGSLEFAN
jgi:adenylyltransferase/sulfurtransferase